MELPGASLQKACRLLVVFCALHLSAVLFYYLRGNTLGHQRSPEPPPRSQTFGRRESEALLPANVSKLAADCPDPSPLLCKCGAPRTLPRSPRPTEGAPGFSPTPAFASPRGFPAVSPGRLCLSLLEASFNPLPHRASLLQSPLFFLHPFLFLSLSGPACHPPLKKPLARSVLRDLPLPLAPCRWEAARPSAEQRSFSHGPERVAFPRSAKTSLCRLADFVIRRRRAARLDLVHSSWLRCLFYIERLSLKSRRGLFLSSC